MYDREKGELKYSPELGYFYECDQCQKEKNTKIAKISSAVIALSLIGGGIFWFTNKPTTPSAPKSVIKDEPTTPTQATTSPVVVQKPIKNEEINKSVASIVPKPNIEKTLTKPSDKVNTTPSPIGSTKAVETSKLKKNNSEDNSSDAVFNRGEKKVFFTSMGKSVEGATIKKNVEEINLKFDDSKAKKEIKKEQNKNKVEEKKTASTKKDKKSQKNITYSVTVKSGDTIYKIAKRVYGSSKGYKKILKANKIKNNRGLKIGQKLIIPPK